MGILNDRGFIELCLLLTATRAVAGVCPSLRRKSRRQRDLIRAEPLHRVRPGQERVHLRTGTREDDDERLRPHLRVENREERRASYAGSVEE